MVLPSEVPMKRFACLLAVVLAILVFRQRAFGQRPPDGGTRDVLISILIPSITDAPFTATVNTEWIRSLDDGSTITLVNHRAIARDKAGRIFQERRLLLPDDPNQHSIVTQIEISDPVAHELYICVPSGHTCQVEVLQAPEGKRFSRALPAIQPGTPGVEDLGMQTTAGLQAIGRRESSIIPEGAIGNNRPLTASFEYWYSPQLGVNLISKRRDPRFGLQNFQLSDVILKDPDPALFQPPPGFRLTDLREVPQTTTSAATPKN